MKKLIKFAFVFALFLIIPIFAYAQIYVPEGIEEQVSVTVNPQNPGPFQGVSISLVSYSRDLNATNITWRQNGSIVSSGIGAKSFNFQTGELNKLITITATISTGGTPLVKTFTFRPADADIIYEAFTYTPALYKGKAIFTHQSPIIFTAIPHFLSSGGTRVPKTNLIYTWNVDGEIMGDRSGYGRNTYSTVGSIISQPFSVGVEIEDPNTGSVVSRSVSVSPESPEVLIYEDHPLYGLIDSKNIVGNVTLTQEEITVQSVPLFFALDDFDSIQNEWRMGGKKIGSLFEDALILRRTNDEAGRSTVSLSITEPSKLLQSATGGFVLNFEQR